MKYTLSIATTNFLPEPVSDLNLQVQESDEVNGFECNQTTIITVINDKGKELRIKLDWHNGSLNDKIHTLLVPATNFLFYGLQTSWGIIDLEDRKLTRSEWCIDFWSFEQHGNSTVVITELYAEALNQFGETIDRVNIDPPFESQDFEDRIEFNSPTFGKQILALQ